MSQVWEWAVLLMNDQISLVQHQQYPAHKPVENVMKAAILYTLTLTLFLTCRGSLAQNHFHMDLSQLEDQDGLFDGQLHQWLS